MSTQIITPSDDFYAAIARMSSSDRLELRGGSYSGIDSNDVSLPSGNSWSDAPVITNYQNETVTLSACNIAAPSGAGQNEIKYLILNGLRINGGGNNALAFWGAVNHVRVQYCDIFGASNSLSGVNFQPNNSLIDPTFMEILYSQIHDNGSGSGSGSVGHGIYGACQDSLFRGLTVYNNGDYGLQFYSEYISPDRNVIEASIFYDNGQGSNVTGGAVTMRGVRNKCLNVITYNHRGAGIAARGDNHQIAHCTVYKCGTDGYPGIYITGGTAEVKNNISCQSNGIGGGQQSNNLVTEDASIFVNAA